jgi:hypothetical protein
MAAQFIGRKPWYLLGDGESKVFLVDFIRFLESTIFDIEKSLELVDISIMRRSAKRVREIK